MADEAITRGSIREIQDLQSKSVGTYTFMVRKWYMSVFSDIDRSLDIFIYLPKCNFQLYLMGLTPEQSKSDNIRIYK